ncbi:hypothetical protein P8452_77083 [Trifolium repens]|nr:hypothetical protein P8452_77083 [Trifolium repens]
MSDSDMTLQDTLRDINVKTQAIDARIVCKGKLIEMLRGYAVNPPNTEQIESRIELEVAELNDLHQKELENSKLALGERQINDDGAGHSGTA